MEIYEKPVERLIREFMRMPTVGPKTAQRLAFFIISSSKEEVDKLCAALMEVKEKIRLCSRCFNLAERNLCRICANEKRDGTILCVVADFRDLASIERSGEYKGLYHVLGGLISPIEGIGPDELRIRELLLRVKEEEIKEIIMATNPNVNGEATALYISKLLERAGVKITRIAYGLPVGAHLEFADDITVAKALEGRREL